MKWSGIQDAVTDISPVGVTDINYMENGSLFIVGEFGRRPGFGARIANAGIVCAELNGKVIFVKANGNIESEAQ